MPTARERMPVKLHLLTRYDRRGASSRLRLLQFIAHLEQSGFRVSTDCLFDASYLDALYAGRREPGAILRAYRSRLSALKSALDADLIWLEKEALPWVPAGLEHRLFPRDVPVVSDFDDAVFHRYDSHANPMVRALLGRKIARVMSNSTLVLAGNAYLGAYAERAGADRIEIVPTVVDAAAYDGSPTPAAPHPTVGWIGTPGTWRECVAPFLPDILDTLRPLRSRILAVGAGALSAQDAAIDLRDWSEEREAADIRDMDIGIMPLPDTPWMRGKCGYKLIQYMACGLPVVASPVGVNADIVTHGETGFLASTPAEWRSALKTLIHDPDLRLRMGQAGRKRVERDYSLQVHGPRVARMFADLVRRAV
ncbi:glycosyltransferase family 4 protein [Roseicyclus amphidinii]|uniref:glycosyltransferase family 4 protein n=1 Tax=Roseicyclus amphidinii TaxID=3034232 RepID=UPI0024E10FE9|nr:glycosyltransferase family 4 protein [Roseicyclus sp. Amp-Y-6]